MAHGGRKRGILTSAVQETGSGKAGWSGMQTRAPQGAGWQGESVSVRPNALAPSRSGRLAGMLALHRLMRFEVARLLCTLAACLLTAGCHVGVADVWEGQDEYLITSDPRAWRSLLEEGAVKGRAASVLASALAAVPEDEALETWGVTSSGSGRTVAMLFTAKAAAAGDGSARSKLRVVSQDQDGGPYRAELQLPWHRCWIEFLDDRHVGIRVDGEPLADLVVYSISKAGLERDAAPGRVVVRGQDGLANSDNAGTFDGSRSTSAGVVFHRHMELSGHTQIVIPELRDFAVVVDDGELTVIRTKDWMRVGSIALGRRPRLDLVEVRGGTVFVGLFCASAERLVIAKVDAADGRVHAVSLNGMDQATVSPSARFVSARVGGIPYERRAYFTVRCLSDKSVDREEPVRMPSSGAPFWLSK
jgi:hypothetical protein